MSDKVINIHRQNCNCLKKLDPAAKSDCELRNLSQLLLAFLHDLLKYKISIVIGNEVAHA